MAGFLPKRQNIGKLKDKKEESRKNQENVNLLSQRLLKWKVEMEGFKKDCGILRKTKNKALQDRGALPREEGDAIREFKAMHEENFLGSWLREDWKSKKKRSGIRKSEKTKVKKEKEAGRKKKMKRLSRGNV